VLESTNHIARNLLFLHKMQALWFWANSLCIRLWLCHGN